MKSKLVLVGNGMAGVRSLEEMIKLANQKTHEIRGAWEHIQEIRKAA